MTNNRCLFLALLAISFSSASPAYSQQAVALPPVAGPPLSIADRKRALESYMSALGRYGFSGGAFVARGDEILLRSATGMADRARNLPNTPETVFNTASLTKQFTGAAIVKLELQGKLSTSDSIRRFFPNAPADKRAITLQQLLTHSSGIGQSPGGGVSPDRDAEIAEILARPLAAPPGQRMIYANEGYTLLAAVIEKASGTTYERYLRDNLWLPAGMQKTGMALPTWTGSTAVHYYVGPLDNGDAFARTAPNWRNMGSGGVLTTLEDMYRWYRALRDNIVLTAEGRRKLTTPSRGYAYGWGIRPSPWGTEIEHDGGTSTGVGTDMRFFLDSNIVVISFANDDGETTLLGAVRDKLRSLAMGRNESLPPAPVATDRSALLRAAGNYRLANGDVITVVAGANGLELRAAGQRATNLLWTGEDRSLPNWVDVAGRTERVLTAGMKGDSATIRATLPARVRLPSILASWRTELEQQLGAFQRVQILGTREGPPGAREEQPTEARLHFARGSAEVVFVWIDDDVAAFQRLPGQRSLTFVPVGNGDYASYNFETGAVRRIRLSGNTILLGTAEAVKVP